MLPFADHITVLSGDGRVVNHDFSSVKYGNSETASVTAASIYDSDEGDAISGHGEHAAPASVVDASDATITDASRQTGDMSVYLYYARAAGLTATACFLIVTAACTFCESFAGELQVRTPII